MERSTLSERSRKLFTLSAIYGGCAALLEGTHYQNSDDAAEVCVRFWNAVSKYIPEWGMVRAGRMAAGEVRRDFLHSHAIVLQALGMAGRDLLSHSEQD